MRGGRSRLARAVAAALLAALLVPPAAARASSSEEGLDTRIFSVRFKPMEEIILLIEPYIGERGSYMVQPRLKTITVRDEPERLARMEGLIARFDQPPRSLRLVVQLLDAVEAPPARAQRRTRGTGVPTLIDDFTKWSEVSVIGSASVIGVEGANSTLNIGDRYRVRFSVGTVAEPQGVARLDRFALDRIVKESDGTQRYFPILDTVLNLRDGRPLLLGATKTQDSQRALFVSVTATLEPGGPVPPSGGR